MKKSKFKIILFVFLMLLLSFPSQKSLIKAGEQYEPINYSNNISGLYNNVKDGVVVIHNITSNGVSVGSGMIYKEDSSLLYIITNYHVVKGYQKIHVDYYNGEYKESFYLGGDEYMDIAIIVSPKPSQYKVLTYGNSDYSKIGEEVVAIGNPVSSTLEYTTTSGIISKKDIEITYGDFYKNRHLTMVDMPLNPGNSGGPTFNIYGQVIGVNSMKYTTNGTNYYEGLNFMIPINDALMVANRIENHNSHLFVRPFIGNGTFYNVTDYTLFQREDLNFPATLTSGVYIASLNENNNPLKDAGLNAHTIILELAGQKVENVVQLRRIIYFLNIYQKVEIKYIDLFNNEEVQTSTVAVNALVFEGV